MMASIDPWSRAVVTPSRILLNMSLGGVIWVLRLIKSRVRNP